MPNLRQPARCTAPRAEGEDGFILLVVLFLMALLLVALAIAAPKVAISIQREREIELVHRGEQYKRAIKLYYKKFGAYPSSIDQLVKTNEIRFLRKRYTDPITGKDDWRLIYMGQAKVPPMGFFGQPLTGLAGPTNVGTPIGGAATGPTTATPAFGASNSGAAPFGSSGSSAFGSSPSEPPNTGASVFTAPDSDTGNTPNTSGSTSIEESSPTQTVVPGTGTGTAGAVGGGAFGSSSSGNPTLGGGPIVGVGIPSPKASLLTYKKQTHYKDWEFVYNPIEDQMRSVASVGGSTQNVNGTNGTTGTGTNSGATGDGFGQGSGSSGTGFGSTPGSSGTGFGSTPTPPAGTNPQQPQQQ